MTTTPLLPCLSPVRSKPLTAQFNCGLMSSDGGAIVLREIAGRLQLAVAIRGPIADVRAPARIQHT